MAPPLPTAVLTFDVEEFDLPNERGQPITLDEQLRIGREGFERILALLSKHDIPATFFMTGVFAEANADLVRSLDPRHELASHQYSHSTFELADLAKSKRVLESISSRQVLGFRRARMAPTPRDAIIAAGYAYDSSLNPTWLPGRYNHRDKPRVPFVDQGLLTLPASVTPTLRVPLFWLAFKNFPRWYFRSCAARTLAHTSHVNHYFHPWEFTDLSRFNLPRHVRRVDNDALLTRLDDYITWLKPRATFTTFAAMLPSIRASLPRDDRGPQNHS